MTSTIPSARPKLDDQYWFTFSELLVTNALANRDQAAAKLQNLVLWLWGIYTGLAAVGFTLAGKHLSAGDTLAITAASGALIAVYWLTVWVQMPRLVAFDPRSPDEIKESAYAANLKAKHWRLTLALATSVLAALLVAKALIVASTAKAETTQPRLSAAMKADGTSRTVMITAHVGKTDSVNVFLRVGQQTEKHSFLPTENGLIQLSIPTALQGAPLRVILEWTEASGGTSFELSRTVK